MVVTSKLMCSCRALNVSQIWISVCRKFMCAGWMWGNYRRMELVGAVYSHTQSMCVRCVCVCVAEWETVCFDLGNITLLNFSEHMREQTSVRTHIYTHIQSITSYTQQRVIFVKLSYKPSLDKGTGTLTSCMIPHLSSVCIYEWLWKPLFMLQFSLLHSDQASWSAHDNSLEKQALQMFCKLTQSCNIASLLLARIILCVCVCVCVFMWPNLPSEISLTKLTWLDLHFQHYM